MASGRQGGQVSLALPSPSSILLTHSAGVSHHAVACLWQVPHPTVGRHEGSLL